VKKLTVILAIIVFSAPVSVISQEMASKFEVSANAGLTSSFGDFYRFKGLPLNENVQVGYGILAEKMLNNYIGFGGQLVFGDLEGYRYDYRTTEGNSMDLHFKTRFFEHSLISSFSINRLLSSNPSNTSLNIYLRAGMGWLHWRNDVTDLKTGKRIAGNGHSGMGLNGMTTEAVIPVGLGFKIPLGTHFNLNFETTFRFVDTDILDGIKDGSRYDMYAYSFAGLS